MNHSHTDPAPETGKHRGHGLMMMVCCIPMLLIAVVVVATGVAGPGVLVFAVMCTLMMAAMMGGMSHGDHDDTNRPGSR